jgi:hypothetical protein
MPVVRDQQKEAEAEAAIAKDCARLGVMISSPWDFVGNDSLEGKVVKLDDPKVMELLSRHLDNEYPVVIMRGLIFALAKLEARPFAFEKMLTLLRKHNESSNGQDAANAVMRMLMPSDVQLVEDLVLDTKLGNVSAFFIPQYVKFKRKGAIPVLRQLLAGSVKACIIDAARSLATLNDQASKSKLELLVENSDADIRKSARDAMKRLGKKAIALN